MLRDITIGQYYQTDSSVHRLDPRVKLAGIFIYILMLFCCGNAITYFFSAIILAIVIGLSKIPVSYVFRGIKSILVILFISVFFNVFFTPGKILVQFYFIKIKGACQRFFHIFILGGILFTLCTYLSIF